MCTQTYTDLLAEDILLRVAKILRTNSPEQYQFKRCSITITLKAVYRDSIDPVDLDSFRV